MSAEPSRRGVYGEWSEDIAAWPPDAEQFSPVIMGSAALEEVAPGSLAGLSLLAPPGTVERRAVLAQALRALAPGGTLVALAPNDKGGTRLAAELEGFGCAVERASRRHHRIATTQRPDRLLDLDAALEAGAPRFVEAAGGWSQPGVFSWDRVDPGTSLLLETLPRLAGRVADLGCGTGLLARNVLASPDVSALALVDIDRRAIACARRNVVDPRAAFLWADARRSDLSGLDHVVANPPFHGPGGREDQGLGQSFLRAASGVLRKGGTAHIVANRHLAYEGVLRESFKEVEAVADRDGFKVLRARR